MLKYQLLIITHLCLCYGFKNIQRIMSTGLSLRPCSPEHSKGSVGIIIVDHGSRKAEANEMLFDIVDQYKQFSNNKIVEAAHMELAEPSIKTG